MSFTPNIASLRQNGKPIKLIPVGLNEAALDSPTFRSGFTHFSEQLDYLEKWLENYLRSVTKLSQETGAFETCINVFLSAVTSPPLLSEAVIDHDYTLLAMRRYGEGVRDFWTTTLSGLKKMEANMVEPIRAFLYNDMRVFKETRRNLEISQKNLDNLQSRYAAQTKLKEPSTLREDAFQLHEARKACLKVSMDFGVLAPTLRMALDKMLVKMVSDQWRDMRNPREHMGSSMGRWGSDIERVRGWARDLESGEKLFRQELQSARKQIEESAELASRPSRDLEDYSATSASKFRGKGAATANRQPQEKRWINRPEKQGWLNIRTVTGKPTRTVWPRRWFYVKNGIFGWLVQGSRSGGVEESERIGVLLCSVRLAVWEERRFCFEVKTKDTSTLLQAETHIELLDWIEAFEVAKQRALEDPSNIGSPSLAGQQASDAAFAILPPSAPEFSASVTEFGIQQHGDDSSTSVFDRSPTLPIPGADSSSSLVNRSGFDTSTHRRSTYSERDGEGGKDHASKIIQKLDLHRKSTNGPQIPGYPTGPISSSPTVPTGGIASLIAASHNMMPVGLGMLPPPPPSENPPGRGHSMTTSRELPTSTLAPNTLVNPPASTNLSSIAVMVNGEQGVGTSRIDVTGGMPSAIIANIWGTSNWGYLNRLEREELKDPQNLRAQFRDSTSMNTRSIEDSTQALTSSRHDQPLIEPRFPSPSYRQVMSLEDGKGDSRGAPSLHEGYPSFYPPQLKNQDAQFRLLFPNIGRDEKTVLVFRSTWNLNDEQEFPGRVYVTAGKMYFYSNHLGLVLISEIGLDSITEVTAAPGRDCDFLFVHLKATDEINGLNRVTIKTFLEPLRLLQRRLNFLIRNCNLLQCLDLESIMNGLIKFEQEDPVSSPSLESWEEISAHTPLDDGSLLSHRASHKDSRDLQTKVLVDGRLYGGVGKPDGGKENSKFKLPGQPVAFVPTGMDNVAVERIFDISPKALFHVMFGDRSAVWQLLYHERQAQCIRQGSWNRLKQGIQRREFEYRIDSGVFGRRRQRKVMDYQTIDVWNDHLCYVVTDRKTPWHLPYSQNFQLLSKVVITHVAKSSCKLAIYIKVDWIKSPGYAQDAITRHALADLKLDALDLADVINDQVRKLGPQSRTKKAIQIFGSVGQQTQASEFTGTDLPLISRTRRTMRKYTLPHLLFEALGTTMEGLLTSLLTELINFLQWGWKTVNANRVILGVLVVSIVTNLILSSSNTWEWRRERNAGDFMARMGVGPNLRMSKTIYLYDLYSAATGDTGAIERPENKCHETFRKITSLSDMDAPTEASSLGLASRGTTRRLRLTRQQMGSHRHDLLVALRVINSIEREMVQAEWEHWLAGENRKCQRLGIMIRENGTEALQPNERDVYNRALKGKYTHDGAIRAWYESYCESCSQERIRQLK